MIKHKSSSQLIKSFSSNYTYHKRICPAYDLDLLSPGYWSPLGWVRCHQCLSFWLSLVWNHLGQISLFLCSNSKRFWKKPSSWRVSCWCSDKRPSCMPQKPWGQCLSCLWVWVDDCPGIVWTCPWIACISFVILLSRFPHLWSPGDTHWTNPG